ncbi:BMP family lipoprotein [Azospirillum brasilense]|uniref:BMP family lipoprotein n=1 Tax=Azospirillum brasilense TaxID=192 RepID=UPI001FFE68C4|nr:BMP family ABC transporter substrate-binding protein [Azospirillum brasilense]
MTRILSILALSLTAATVPAAGPALAADEFMPAVVFDQGGKFDKSFNEAAYNGAERFKKETGIVYREFEVTSESQREQALRNMARRGATVITAVGFSQSAPVGKGARGDPQTEICPIDDKLGAPQRPTGTLQGHGGSLPGGMLGGAGPAGPGGGPGGGSGPSVGSAQRGRRRPARRPGGWACSWRGTTTRRREVTPG